MIDVHIIRFNEQQWQIDRCLASLSNEPITIHWVDGIKEFPPNQGRKTGYSLGNHPYVSYVDPDDYIEPGAYTKLLYAIQSGNYDAAYGWERVVGGNRIGRIVTTPHHAFVLKRGLDINYSNGWRIFVDRYWDKSHKTVEVKEVLYYRDMGSR